MLFKAPWGFTCVTFIPFLFAILESIFIWSITNFFISPKLLVPNSNIAYFDSSSKKGIKIGYKFDEKNKKIRINKSTGKEI